MANEVDDEIEQEYQRWKDYAGVLLLALTVLVGFTSFTLEHRNTWGIWSAIVGVLGIVLTVSWHAREKTLRFKIRNEPGLLFVASMCLGAQAALLVFMVMGISST